MKKIFILLFISLSLSAQVRVEPSLWWVGMKQKEVQVLVHAPAAGKANLRVNYPGVKVNKVHKAESPNYLFVDLHISEGAKPGKVELLLQGTDGKVSKGVLELQQRNPHAGKGFGTEDVIYLITPDRFANGDASNDNTADTQEKLNRAHYNGRHGGDLKGIENHLDYIRDMGFTTLWCMPLLENNLKEVTYHGYSITDYYRTDPRYGTNEQFRGIVEKSRTMGLKWIMDVVLNHCGIDHWWMKDLPFADWINNDAKFTPSSHRREVHQDIHVAQKDLEAMKGGWFVPTMPDLNQRNPFMARYLTQNTIWWIEYAGLSGLRIDTWPYSEKAFLQSWTKAVMDEYPQLHIVGEEWTTKAQTIAYWQKGKVNADGYVSHIPGMMDFPFQAALGQALTEPEGFHSGLARLYSSITDDYLYPDPDKLVVFGDNHDMNRFFTQVKEDKQMFKMGLAVIATMRGIPQIYYGTEIGMSNPTSEEHGVLRADMPGGWEGDKANAFTGENLSPLQKELQEFTRKLFQWRKNTPVVHTGKLMHFVPQDGIYTYFRYAGNEKVWVIMNKKETAQKLRFEDYAEMIPNGAEFADVLDSSVWKTEVSVPAKGFRILRLK